MCYYYAHFTEEKTEANTEYKSYTQDDSQGDCGPVQQPSTLLAVPLTDPARV